jgi:cytochrome c peroxidase
MTRFSAPLLCALVALWGFATPALATGSGAGDPLHSMLADYQRPATAPVPADNPMTPEKVALGQMLFFDPRLSGSGAISCASCHNPGLGWEDALPKGLGHMGTRLSRHTPTILNVAWSEPLFWDGRAGTLEEQAKGPIVSEAEMNLSADHAAQRLQAIPGYVDAFARVFPGKAISLDTIAAAIAAFERTVVSGIAPFDRWVNGDEQAVPETAKRGFVLFNGKANCATCHMGWRMTDDGFHDIGLSDTDPGRAKVSPGIVQLENAFKTPTLRNIQQRAPYMHDGSLATLAAVIDHYDAGFVQRPSLDSQMRPLGLTVEEKSDLLAFLESLTSIDPAAVVPALPH